MIKGGEVVVYPTDKSGKFYVDTRENYINCMRQYVEKNSVITEGEKEKSVRQWPQFNACPCPGNM